MNMLPKGAGLRTLPTTPSVPFLSEAAQHKRRYAMRIVKSPRPSRWHLIKSPSVAMIVAAAIALVSPNAVLAAGRTHSGGGHAVARVDARPLVGRDHAHGRVRPYGYYIVPGFGFRALCDPSNQPSHPGASAGRNDPLGQIEPGVGAKNGDGD
jgi:hypothetical protein